MNVLAKYDLTADLESDCCKGVQLFSSTEMCALELYQVQAGRQAGRQTTCHILDTDLPHIAGKCRNDFL